MNSNLLSTMPGNARCAEEKQTNGADVKVNGTNSDPHAPVTSQKYSQILSDHHTNSSAHQSNKNSSHYSYKSRAYNNKENFYNQRAGGRPGAQRSWQRGGNYRTSIASGRDKPEEGEKTGSNDITDSPPIKFNEGNLMLKRPHKSFSHRSEILQIYFRSNYHRHARML